MAGLVLASLVVACAPTEEKDVETTTSSTAPADAGPSAATQLCGVLPSADVALAVGTEDLTQHGTALHPPLGERPAAGNCTLEDAEGQTLLGVIADASTSTFADRLRTANEDWRVDALTGSGAEGWSAHLGADTRTGYAWLEQDGTIVAVTVHRGVEGTDGAESSARLARTALDALLPAGDTADSTGG